MGGVGLGAHCSPHLGLPTAQIRIQYAGESQWRVTRRSCVGGKHAAALPSTRLTRWHLPRGAGVERAATSGDEKPGGVGGWKGERVEG